MNLHGGRAAILYRYQTAVELTHWRVIRTLLDAQNWQFMKSREGLGSLTVRNGEAILPRPPNEPRWILSGIPARIDPFYARQTPLLLTVPRPKNGFFLWPVKSIEYLGPSQIRATLEPPEY